MEAQVSRALIAFWYEQVWWHCPLLELDTCGKLHGSNLFERNLFRLNGCFGAVGTLVYIRDVGNHWIMQKASNERDTYATEENLFAESMRAYKHKV
jgi:hypothetical protein